MADADGRGSYTDNVLHTLQRYPLPDAKRPAMYGEPGSIMMCEYCCCFMQMRGGPPHPDPEEKTIYTDDMYVVGNSGAAFCPGCFKRIRAILATVPSNPEGADGFWYLPGADDNTSCMSCESGGWLVRLYNDGPLIDGPALCGKCITQLQAEPVKLDQCVILGDKRSLCVRPDDVEGEKAHVPEELGARGVRVMDGFGIISNSFIKVILPHPKDSLLRWALMEPGIEETPSYLGYDGRYHRNPNKFGLAVCTEPPYPVALIMVHISDHEPSHCSSGMIYAFRSLDEYLNAYSQWLEEVKERPPVARGMFFDMVAMEASCTTFAEKVAIMMMNQWDTGYGIID